MQATWEGKEIEVDFTDELGDWAACELRVLGVPVELTDELTFRLNDLSEELE